MLAVSPMELFELAAVVVAAGAISGLLAGLFGIGGGAVMVPVFYQLLGVIGVDESVRMHVAVATSTGVILPTSLRSYFAHKARGAVDMELLRGWVVWVPLGVILATALAAFISSEGLRAIFAVIALVLAARMLLNRDSWRLGTALPGNPGRAIFGSVLGFLSTLMGIGGGVINNTFMTLYGRSMHQAVATSSGVGVLISIPATIGYIVAGWGRPELPPFSLGFVNAVGVALLIPVSLWVTPYGVRLAHALSRRKLEILFGLFLISVSIKFGWSLL
ncbi:sulfite exporter TauE/SafE family protein [Methylobrevis albus]|uniref:Probable membrane transporter protein n=1 Tax=Methylobrevis albus TaxID=2793297 RepID=A0A931MY36_9HYPH|nr:sulfite exporter TauE/SafE family protein [Methylobrevis albus]MBH0239948.1 sulfite exporter TauE/SafE family protein [Methylobrevis albus]